MGIFDFMKRVKEDIEVNRIVEKVKQRNELVKIVNKAISFRSLNRYSEAILLLKEVSPFYKPALSILGNTYLQINEVDKAENIFRSMITDCNTDENRMLIIEAYCNLGNLYYEYKKDKTKAIQYYEKAITVMEPKSVDDVNEYNVILSGAYMGLCKIYTLENDIDKAKDSAFRCIKLNPNVDMVNRVYGIIIANTILEMPRIDILKKKDIIVELKQAKDSLVKVLSNDDSDIDALYAICIVINTICVLKVLGYISSDHNIERISIENDKYYKMFEDLSHQSDEANKNLESYKDYISSLASAGLQSKGYKLKEDPLAE